MNSRTTKTKLIDVSVGLSPTTPVWPGAPTFGLEQKTTDLGGGEAKMDSHFSMIPHCGTHIDAPLHFASGGDAIDAVCLDLLVGPCRVFEHSGDGHIAKDDLVAMGFVPLKRILIKTHNSRRLREGTLDKDFISLLPDAIDHLARSGVQVLGVDGFAIGPYGELCDRNHLVFCGTGGIIIEVLDLSEVEAGEYNLIALPIKLMGVEAAPARVALLRSEDVGSVFGCSPDRGAGSENVRRTCI
jgi:arylformamidase